VALLGHQEASLNAGAPPTVNDDITLGYTVGSRWIDTTNDKEYVCLDNTNGAAVWAETTGAASPLTDYCMVHRTTAQAIVSGVETPVSWEVEDYDTNGMWAIGDPTHILIKTAGLYHVIGHAVFEKDVAADARFFLLKFERGGDTTMFSAQMFPNANTNRDLAAVVSGYVNLQVNDTVRFDVRQFTGGNLDVVPYFDADPFFYWRPWMQVLWVRAAP